MAIQEAAGSSPAPPTTDQSIRPGITPLTVTPSAATARAVQPGGERRAPGVRVHELGDRLAHAGREDRRDAPPAALAHAGQERGRQLDRGQRQQLECRPPTHRIGPGRVDGGWSAEATVAAQAGSAASAASRWTSVRSCSSAATASRRSPLRGQSSSRQPSAASALATAAPRIHGARLPQPSDRRGSVGPGAARGRPG